MLMLPPLARGDIDMLTFPAAAVALLAAGLIDMLIAGLPPAPPPSATFFERDIFTIFGLVPIDGAPSIGGFLSRRALYESVSDFLGGMACVTARRAAAKDDRYNAAKHHGRAQQRSLF